MCSGAVMKNNLPKDIKDSLLDKLDKSIQGNKERLEQVENTKNYLISIDHDLSKTLPMQISHLSEKFPQASSSALKSIRKVMLPELLNNPHFLLLKNSARVDPVMENDSTKTKMFSKFLDKKKQGAFDDPGNSYESFMHMTLSKNIDKNKPRYLYESNFDERRQKNFPGFSNSTLNVKHPLKNQTNSSMLHLHPFIQILKLA